MLLGWLCSKKMAENGHFWQGKNPQCSWQKIFYIFFHGDCDAKKRDALDAKKKRCFASRTLEKIFFALDAEQNCTIFILCNARLIGTSPWQTSFSIEAPNCSVASAVHVNNALKAQKNFVVAAYSLKAAVRGFFRMGTFLASSKRRLTRRDMSSRTT